MALIKCPECKKDVSSTAPTCPHCGYQLKKPTQTSVARNRSRAQELYEKEHDRKYKEMIASGIICLIAAVFFLFCLVPFGSYGREVVVLLVSSAIGLGIAGVILLAVGIHRLYE